MKLISKSISQNLYRSVLIATMATLAVGCGSSSNDTVGVEDPDDTIDNTDTDTETLTEDRYSLDASWSNNSLLSTATNSSSSYTKGLQRIIFCLGSHPDNQTIVAFSDGIFGPNTKAAVEQFQTDSSIAVDGIVGPETWGALQNIVELDPEVDAGNGYNSHSLISNDCGTEPQFYQNQTGNGDWKLAKTPGSTTMVQFSINGPDED